jgi:hypothetical protein
MRTAFLGVVGDAALMRCPFGLNVQSLDPEIYGVGWRSCLQHSPREQHVPSNSSKQNYQAPRMNFMIETGQDVHERL